MYINTRVWCQKPLKFWTPLERPRDGKCKFNLFGEMFASIMMLLRIWRRLLRSWANGVTSMSWPEPPRLDDNGQTFIINRSCSLCTLLKTVQFRGAYMKHLHSASVTIGVARIVVALGVHLHPLATPMSVTVYRAGMSWLLQEHKCITHLFRWALRRRVTNAFRDLMKLFTRLLSYLLDRHRQL